MIAGVLLAISLFVPWYGLTEVPQRTSQDAWICGAGNYSCTAWQTFPVNRWLFLLAAAAPFILTYLVASNQKGKYPTGEFTMTAGLAVVVLAGFNGLISKPGSTVQFGISLKIGFWLAMLAGLLMAGAGAMRSLKSGGGAQRKPPATY